MSRGVRSTLAVIALTTGLACSSLAADFEPLVPEPIWISGRVVDRHDRPVRYASVSATPQSVDSAIKCALSAASRVATNADGWFNIAVPFAGIRYSVSVENMGWMPEWPSVLAGRGGPITLRLTDVFPARSVGGTVVDEADHPVSNASVHFFTENGVSDNTVTDADGRFMFDRIPECLGEISLVVRAKGLVGRIRGERQNHKLLLVRPGRIKGSVVTKDSGAPVAGATVIIGACFFKGVRMRTTSDRSGMFELSDVPEGVYVVQAESDAYFDNLTGFLKIPVREGGTATPYIEMEPVARFVGRVTDRNGRAVARALVGAWSSWIGEAWEQYRYVQTDRDGEFSLSTGHARESLEVEVFSAQHGSATMSVGPLSPGGVARLTVRLPGAIGLHGVVVDPVGRPIPDICCGAPGGPMSLFGHGVSDKTDEAGHFDLGLIPIGSQIGQQFVTFMAPRPYDPWTQVFHDKSTFPASRPAATRYYQFKRVQYDTTPNGNIELKVTLEPAKLLTFSGHVFDRNGQSVAGAPVHLFAGIPVNWYETLHPSRSSARFSHDLQLCGTTTSADGQWIIQVVRETAESMDIAYSRSNDPTEFSIVAEAPNGANLHVMQSITIAEHVSELQIDLMLDVASSPRQHGH